MISCLQMVRIFLYFGVYLLHILAVAELFRGLEYDEQECK